MPDGVPQRLSNCGAVRVEIKTRRIETGI
uniref:Uncharacterized protein n=1 Tax=Anguilla anguilla TaxID=7936 RepID=A0A0E9PTC2_ANGAN